MPFRDLSLVVGGVLFVAGFAASQPEIASVGLVIIVLGWVGRYWSRHLFDRVTLHRKPSETRVFIGEKVPLTVELTNRKPLPLPWYEWRLALSEHLSVEKEHLAAAAVPGQKWLVRRGALGWYQRHDWTFTLAPDTRGYHQVGTATIRSGDLLGAYPRSIEDDEREHLVVFPRVFSMEDMGLPSERPFGERKGGNRVFEDPLRIAGLREYRPGDPLRRIDWKATARSGDLRSRVYEPSATQQLYLVVNIDTMEHAWEGYLRDELERIVSVSASLCVWAAGARYAVGLLANGAFPEADRPMRLPPSRSRDQVSRLLEALAVIQPLTMGDLAGAIQRESGKLPQGSTLVVVASLMPPPLAGVLARLHDEGHNVFVIATSDRVRDSVPPGIGMREVGGVFQRAEVLR
ncbi:MAG: DUF58 domain-containing protein [Dehalococcoidia bacterium]|nr:DUF58 domain-containing protein [Dehalococcoidia bacterium]